MAQMSETNGSNVNVQDVHKVKTTTNTTTKHYITTK